MNTNHSHLRDKHSWITPKEFGDLLEHSYQRHREDGAQTFHRQMGIDYRLWLRVSEHELRDRLRQARELVCLTEV